MTTETKDPVAARIVDEHGQVAVVRVSQEKGAYVETNSRHPEASKPGPRLKGDTTFERWTLEGLPLAIVPLYCRRGWHSTAVSVVAVRQAVAAFRTGGPPTKIRLQRDALA